MHHETLARPWEKLGVDYFTLFNQDCLIIVNYCQLIFISI